MNLKECLEKLNRTDILERWDNELNNTPIENVSETDKKKYYFKCPRGIHRSELRHVNIFHSKRFRNLDCKACKSFAQRIIDKYGVEYLNEIWGENDFSPWKYGGESKKIANFKCQKGHIYPQSLVSKVKMGYGCPYCSNRKIDVESENTLGERCPEVLDVWSDKNFQTPYEYAPFSTKEVWFRCPVEKHEDYLRKISVSHTLNFRCPKCSAETLFKPIQDITGNVYGELVVLKYDKELSKEKHETYWICECSCGAIKSILGSHLKDGSIYTCGNRSIHKRGKNSPTWKGGVTCERQLARGTVEYSNWRNSVYAKDYYTCQCCGKSKNIEKNAHHLQNFSANPELRYDVNNGITLCRDCHYTTVKGSFHNLYGTTNNTSEQLEEYINNKRKQLGIFTPFSIEKYKQGEVFHN